MAPPPNGPCGTTGPNPFCEIESSLLWHLDTADNDVVARLVSKLPPPLRRGQVRPLGLDRYGVRFRVEGNDGDHDSGFRSTSRWTT